MEINKELIFEVMVMFPELLEEEIIRVNKWNNTDFEIIETIEEIEIFFCKIKVTKYKIEDIFALGYRLATNQSNKKGQGKYDW